MLTRETIMSYFPDTYNKDEMAKDVPDRVPGGRGECVKPWKWAPADEIRGIPDPFDPAHFRCFDCTREDPPARYSYRGQPLYMCRNCGTVYETGIRSGHSALKWWSALTAQPYDWHRIDRGGESRGTLIYDLIHCSGDIKRHPVIEAHCKSDPAEAAEMMVRYLVHVKGFSEYLRLQKTKEKHISCGSEELVVADGKPDGTFPGDEFCVLREDRDHLTFESNEIEHSNIFGFTADVNEENWETTAEHKLLKITFLSENREDLPSGTEILDHIPVCREWEKKWITKDPFGLDGYFLFELRRDSVTLTE